MIDMVSGNYPSRPGDARRLGATRSRVSGCYDCSLNQDITRCSAIGILPERASLATMGCEAFGTMYPHFFKKWRLNRETKVATLSIKGVGD
jgi:hypothetical protein